MSNYSPTLLINEISKKLIAEGKKVYQMGFGQSPFPVPAAVVGALKKNAHQKNYLPVMGLPALQHSISNYYKNNFDFNVAANQIMIGPGSKELIFLCQMIKDWHLLLPAPSWVSYAPQAKYTNNSISYIPTSFQNKWKITVEDLNNACESVHNKNKLLIINYPNNPTGQTFNDEELKAIAEVAQKHNIIIISDEIYERLTYSQDHQSIYKYYPEGTIISSGLSKWCGAGGWRLGHFLFPKELADLQQKMGELASETFSCVSAPIQYGAVKAYKQLPEIESYLQNSNIILTAISNYVTTSLQALNVNCHAVDGGFYVFPDFENQRSFLNQFNITSSPQLATYLLENLNIACLPGSAFGLPENKLCLRLAFVDFDGQLALNNRQQFLNVAKNANFIETIVPNIAAAVKQLKNWLP